MSYKSYCFDRLRAGDVITWWEKGGRQWAWMTDGMIYVASKSTSPRRLGRRRLAWVFDNRYVDLKSRSEVPDPVALLSQKGR